MNLKQTLKRLLRREKRPIDWRETYEVGRDTYGKPRINHWGESATLKVGSFRSIANDVKIFLGGNHRTDLITTYPFSYFRESAKHISASITTRGDVIIGHDVWLGDGAVILSGVHIGNGAAVGASSVVTKDVPPYAIVVGNPARLIRMRFSDEEIATLQSLEWWHWDDAKLDAAMPHLLANDIEALDTFSKTYDSNDVRDTETA